MSIDRRNLLAGALAAACLPAATRGLAAPALVRSAKDRYTVFDFPGGQEMRGKPEPVADFGQVFTAAVASGSAFEVPPGRYPLRAMTSHKRCVSLISNAPVDIVCAPGATFVAGAELAGLSCSLLGFQNDGEPVPGTATTFHFRGGHFDGSQIPWSNDAGVGMLDIYQYADPLIENVTGFGGATDLAAGRQGAGYADTLVITHNCFRERIVNLKGSGFYDCLLYLSGDNRGDTLDGKGEQAFVTGLSAKRCGNGVAMKRDHVGQVIQNFEITECNNGIIGSKAGRPSNQGKRTHVLNGRLSRIRGRPILLFGHDPLVENVHIEDYGISLVDPQELTGTRRGNEIAAIQLRGGVDGRVAGNTIVLRGGPGRGDGRIGVALSRDDENQPTRGCTVEGNRMSGVPRPIVIEPGSEDNRIGDNPARR